MEKGKEEKITVDKKLLNLPKIEVSYKTLQKQIKAGYAPKEWDAVYDTLLKMVKKQFEEDPERTLVYEEIQSPWQSDYYKIGKEAPYSPAILLNEYLSKRLKSEGYEHACMRLIYIPSSGNMWQKEINAMKQREYEIAYKEWQEQKIRYDTYKPDAITGYTPPQNPGKAPVAPVAGNTSYSSSKYVFIVQCSKEKNKLAKRSEEKIIIQQRKQTKSKHPNLLVFLAYVLPILSLAAALALVGVVLSIVNADFDTDAFIMLAGTLGLLPVFGGGALIGWGIHTKLYKHGYL